MSVERGESALACVKTSGISGEVVPPNCCPHLFSLSTDAWTGNTTCVQALNDSCVADCSTFCSFRKVSIVKGYFCFYQF